MQQCYAFLPASALSVCQNRVRANFSKHCQDSAQVLKQQMPEDWNYEERIRAACRDSVEALCPGVPSGSAQLGRCLR